MYFKSKIINYSNKITTQELFECLQLIPSNYNNLNTKIYIFKSYKQYLYFLLKNFRFIQLFNSIIQPLIDKITKSISSGYYYRFKKEIFIFEDNIMLLCNNRIKDIYKLKSYNKYSKYIKEEDLLVAKNMLFKYITLDNIIHEMTHALQDFENRLSNPLVYIFTKWENRIEEKDAISACIDIFKHNNDRFSQILNVRGVEINHNLSPLRTSYKINIFIRKESP